jgi:hypothetical protein
LEERRPRLFLHVGTPKTGTTTLQQACNASRASLLTRGILYPDVDLHPEPQPKHQWLAGLLLAEDLEGFRRNVGLVAAQARATNASRLILSTEGLYNHWYDFSESGRAALAALKKKFDVTVWVVFREPVSWAMSSYIQAVKNPPFQLAPRYSTTEPLERLIDTEYYVTRLQYARFVQDAEKVFGDGTVHAMRYESGDILEQTRAYLGVDATALASAGDRNKALSMLGLDLMRRLNSMGIAGDERQRVASAIVELDQTLGATSEPVTPSVEVRKKVLAISRESENYLAKRFGIAWDHRR